MADLGDALDRLDAARRRLDDELSHLRQATIRAAQVTFEPVDLTGADDRGHASLTIEQESARRLSELLDEWHEDNGWAVEMPDHVRSDLIARVKTSVDEDVAKGRLG